MDSATPSNGFPSASRPATHSSLNLSSRSIFCSSCKEPEEQQERPSELPSPRPPPPPPPQKWSSPERPLHSFPNWKDRDARTASSAGEEPSHTDMTNGATTWRRSSGGREKGWGVVKFARSPSVCWVLYRFSSFLPHTKMDIGGKARNSKLTRVVCLVWPSNDWATGPGCHPAFIK